MQTPPKTRRRTLRTQLDCRRALAWIFGELEAARLDVQRARVMVYTLQTLSGIVDRSELEAELEAIKHTLAEAGHEVKM